MLGDQILHISSICQEILYIYILSIDHADVTHIQLMSLLDQCQLGPITRLFIVIAIELCAKNLNLVHFSHFVIYIRLSMFCNIVYLSFLTSFSFKWPKQGSILIIYVKGWRMAAEHSILQ